MTFGDWWSLIQRHRFSIEPLYWPRVLIQTATSVSNSIGVRMERCRYGAQIEAARVRAPLFILGHYRSGTTHLHNLLTLDPQLAAPTFLQVLYPHVFLSTERWAGPLIDRCVVRRRFQDEMALAADMPSEDEVAQCTMTGLSPYMNWYFPRGGDRYDRYLTLRDVPADEAARWEAALTHFFRKLTVRYGRPLVLKSPPHTARIRRLLKLFPDARFVHIHRDPYAVFSSTKHLLQTVQPIFRLQRCPAPDGDDRILAVYTEMYNAYFEERGLIPEGRLCDVRFEDLECDPIGVVASIYQSLGLAGFDVLRPILDGYLGSIVGYRKNRLDEPSKDLRRRIAIEWRRSFDAWGYEY
jgi:hypothetical protein